MKKHVTFSRKFPAKHPRAGEPTYFMEKILIARPEEERIAWANSNTWVNLCLQTDMDKAYPGKFHTIRAGKSWKVGDILIPCVWEFDGGRFKKGNKRIQFAPELEIVKVWDIEIKYEEIPKTKGFKGIQAIKILLDGVVMAIDQIALANNDGLLYEDFRNWFMMDKKSFSGQVICWSKELIKE